MPQPMGHGFQLKISGILPNSRPPLDRNRALSAFMGIAMVFIRLAIGKRPHFSTFRAERMLYFR